MASLIILAKGQEIELKMNEKKESKVEFTDEPKIGDILEVGKICTGPVVEILPNGSVLIETSRWVGGRGLVCARRTYQFRTDGSKQYYWEECDYESERRKPAANAMPHKPPTAQIGDRVDLKFSGHTEVTIADIDQRHCFEDRVVAGERVRVPHVDVSGSADVQFHKTVSIYWNYGTSEGQGYWEAEIETAAQGE